MGLYAIYLNYVFEAIRFKLMKKLLFQVVTPTHTFTNKVIIISALIMLELVINYTSFAYNVYKMDSFIEIILEITTDFSIRKFTFHTVSYEIIS